MDERRVNDVRLALIEQKLDLTLKSIEEKFEDLTNEVRKYNGIRQKLETACEDIKEHKEGHWRYTTIFIAIAGVLVPVIFSIMKLVWH